MPIGLIISKNTRIFIENTAKINIEQAFLFGFSPERPTSYWVGGSTINVSDGGCVEIVGSGSPSLIGPASVLNVSGKFQMGDSSYMRSNAHITVQKCIKIGSDCAIARGFSVRDADIHKLKVNGKTNSPEPVIIKDNVWIGTNVSVKKGVTIGEGAVIASDSVVTKDVPSKALVAGVPAEIIESDVTWKP